VVGAQRFTLLGVPCLTPNHMISSVNAHCSDQAKVKYHNQEENNSAIQIIPPKKYLFELLIQHTKR
jgi:hypothetical protein